MGKQAKSGLRLRHTSGSFTLKSDWTFKQKKSHYSKFLNIKQQPGHKTLNERFLWSQMCNPMCRVGPGPVKSHITGTRWLMSETPVTRVRGLFAQYMEWIKVFGPRRSWRKGGCHKLLCLEKKKTHQAHKSECRWWSSLHAHRHTHWKPYEVKFNHSTAVPGQHSNNRAHCSSTEVDRAGNSVFLSVTLPWI